MDELSPVVACNDDAGHCLVTWEGFGNTSGPWVDGRLVYTDKTQGAGMHVAGVPNTCQCWMPAVAAGPPGHFLAWEQERPGTSYIDIHGRLIWPAVIYLP